MVRGRFVVRDGELVGRKDGIHLGRAKSLPRSGESPMTGAALIGLQAALSHGSMPALQQACARVLPELKTMLRALLRTIKSWGGPR